MEGALCDGGGQPGLKLIETMRWDGAAFPRLALHLARLAAGAAALGWQVPLAQVRAALDGLPATPFRVRLTLDMAGDVQVETGPVPRAIPLWRLGLAGVRLSSGDPWLGIKSTHRPAYDAARAALPSTLDEAIFQNARGEVCDGTITTLFFDRGQGLRTPPLSSGLLPGVLRAEMLATGSVREEVFQSDELASTRLWIGNALRGLVPAVWTGTLVA